MAQYGPFRLGAGYVVYGRQFVEIVRERQVHGQALDSCDMVSLESVERPFSLTVASPEGLLMARKPQFLSFQSVQMQPELR